MTYEEFLKTKAITVEACGFECEDRNPKLFDWQNDVVRWALKKGRAASFRLVLSCDAVQQPAQKFTDAFVRQNHFLPCSLSGE